MFFFDKLIQTSNSPYPIILRVMVGTVFLLEGAQKFLYPEDLGVGRFAKIGIPSPDLMAPFVGAVEITAGACLLLGLATRPAALALVTVMAVAICTTKIPILLGREFLGFSLRDLKRYGYLSMAHEMRTDWSMLLGSLYLLLSGAGRWSMDRMITRKPG